MDIHRFFVFFVIFESFVEAENERNFTMPNSIPHIIREKRQIGNLGYVMKNVKRKMNALGQSIDRLVLPRVQYAAEKLRDDVGPSIANTMLDVTNKVILTTAEGIQKSAQFLSDEVGPVLEDTVVEMSNAALPVVNKGLDAVGTGLRTGVTAVSKTTSDGVKLFGVKVLGEERQNRIKKIANNLSINFNNTINNLAGAIKKATKEESIDDSNSDHEIHDFPNGDTNVAKNNLKSHSERTLFFLPNSHPPYDRYQSKYHVYYNEYQRNTDTEPLVFNKNMSIPQAFTKIVGDKAYSLSMQFLGPNLTDAVAPIARSVSNVIRESIPSVPLNNSPLEGNLPEKLRSCTTPDGEGGFCQDLSECPNLVLKLSVLRRSICFKSLLRPGICCPDIGQLKRIRDVERIEAEKLSQTQTKFSQISPTQNQILLSQQFSGQNQFQYPFAVASSGLTQQQQQLLLQQQGLYYGLHPHLSTAAVPQTYRSDRITYDNVVLNQNPKNDNFECGVQKVPRSRVVGGEESGVGEWPWTAAIYLHDKEKTEFWCGGSLISEEYVLTAAHCTKDAKEKTFEANQFTVHLGDYSIFNLNDNKISEPQIFRERSWTEETVDVNLFKVDGQQIVRMMATHYDSTLSFAPHRCDVQGSEMELDRCADDLIYQISPSSQTDWVRHINAHPDFKREGYFNDIALLKLSRSVKFSPYILPVCLPPRILERSHIDALVGQMPSIIGYGSTTYDGPQSNTLRDVRLPIWKNSDCDKAYFQPITHIFLCAGYMEGGKDACQGDSGGPMQLYYQNRWIQLGIVSFGNRCAQPGYPGVYTRITHFLPWIRENLR